MMKNFKMFLVTSLSAAAFLFASPSHAKAQISFGVQIGPEPVCPYGYYDYPPYRCAPFGYYGPEWFNNGVFIGAGPWFHGPEHFHGHVNRHYDPHYGYHGSYPNHGEHADWAHHQGWEHNFHGTDSREEHRPDNSHHDDGHH